MVDGNVGRDPDLRRDAQMLAGFDDGVVQEAKQVRLLIPHDLLDQRKRLRKIRRTSVCALELVQQFVAVEIRRQFPFAHIQIVRIAFQRQREHHVLAVLQHAVAVDPALFRVFDVVIHDEQIDRRDQLEIADVGEEIWLHDGQSHLASP